MRWSWQLLALLVVLVGGCADPNQLTIYADPWLKPYASEMIEEFEQTHPEVGVHVRYLSSELIAQHVHYGQPMDVFLCYGWQFLDSAELGPMMADREVLAGSQLVLVEQTTDVDRDKRQTFGTEGLVMLEASERPSRRYLESMGPVNYSPKLHMIANFQSQAVDYLSRGWVKSGWVPLHHALSDTSRLGVVMIGPSDAKAFMAFRLQNAPHAQLADEFLALLRGKKSRNALVRLDYLP